MADNETPDEMGLIPAGLSPEQKEAVGRRIQPLLVMMLHAAGFQKDLLAAATDIGKGQFDPQGIHDRLSTIMRGGERGLSSDFERIERMLAYEALRADGKLSPGGGATPHAVEEKIRVMRAVGHRRRRVAADRPPEADPIAETTPGPR